MESVGLFLSSGNHDGPGWFFAPFFFLAWLLLIGFAFWFFGRRRAAWWQAHRGPDPFTSASTVLSERFARGEIDSTEYNERLNELRRALPQDRDGKR